MPFPSLDATRYTFPSAVYMAPNSCCHDYPRMSGTSLYGSDNPSWHNSALEGERAKAPVGMLWGGPVYPSSNHMMPQSLKPPHGASSMASSSNSVAPKAPLSLAKDDIPLDARTAPAINDSSLLFDIVLRVIVEGKMTPSVNFGQSIGMEKSPTLDDGLVAMAEFEDTHKDFGVVALNLFASRFEDLYLAQNFRSVQHLGVVAKNFSYSSYRPLLSESSLIGFLRNLLICVRFIPGEEVSFLCRILLVTGEALLRLVMTFSNGVLLVGGECR